MSICQLPRKAMSGPEQNRTETVQNRTGRRSKTGFLLLGIEVDGIERVRDDTWSSSAGYGSAGGQPERRALPKGPLPRCCGMKDFVPQHFQSRQGPLAQCDKLRGFGGSAPKMRDCRMQADRVMLPGVQRNNSFIGCRRNSSGRFSKTSTPVRLMPLAPRTV